MWYGSGVGVLWCAVVGFVLLPIVCGCGAETNGSATTPAEQRDVKLADGTTVIVVRENGQPVSLAMPDGRTISLADGEVVVNDQLIIRSPTGRVEVHRKPNTVIDEVDQLPHLYLKEGTLEELLTQGFRGEPHIGPDNALYWSARICTNPNCDSQSMASAERPQLLINRMPDIWIGDDGKLVSANKMPSSLVSPCPVCGSAEFIRQYILPETASRQAELADELAHVRAARDAAMRTN